MGPEAIERPTADATVVSDRAGCLLLLIPCAWPMAGGEPEGHGERSGATFCQALESALSGALRGEVTIARGASVLLADGTPYRLRLDAVPIIDGRPEPVGAIASLTDVDHETRRERTGEAQRILLRVIGHCSRDTLAILSDVPRRPGSSLTFPGASAIPKPSGGACLRRRWPRRLPRRPCS